MKYFRIAREGKTVDGREITANQIDEMAAQYNPKIYGARIWLEHFRGLFADSPFKALGDVVALKAETDETGRRVLLGSLNPTAELVAMNQDRQKIYTSIELQPNFSDTGKAYLTGLAVTDSPASTGTEALQFSICESQQNTMFSVSEETNFDFNSSDDEKSDDTAMSALGEVEQSSTPSLFDKIKGMFTKQQETIDRQRDDVKEIFADIQSAVTFGIEELQKEQTAFAQSIASLTEELSSLKQELAELKSQLDEQPTENHTTRPLATGGEALIKTDC